MKLYVLTNHPSPKIDAAKVAPGLWIGSQAPTGRTLAEGGFDTLVLCAAEWQPEAEEFTGGLRVIHAPFRDREGAPGHRVLRMLNAVSGEVASRLRKGDECLVTCAAGRNRSGLVTALSLSKAKGMDPALAGERVRQARGTAALTNTTFVNMLNALRGESCELCEGRKETRRYYEDHLFWIADCKTCGVPMVVLRRHSVTPTREEKDFMKKALLHFAGPGFRIDQKRRSIPDHFHMHARPVGVPVA